VGGGSLRAYTVAALAVLLAALACFIAVYPVLKPAAFLIPSVILFFATRSFGSYLVMLIPAAIAAAATTQPRPASAAGGTGSGSPGRGRGLRRVGRGGPDVGEPAEHHHPVPAHDRPAGHGGAARADGH